MHSQNSLSESTARRRAYHMNEPNGSNSTQQPPTTQRASTSHLQTETNNQAESKKTRTKTRNIENQLMLRQ